MLHNRIKRNPAGNTLPKGVSLFSHTLRERLCSNYALLRKEGKHFFLRSFGGAVLFYKVFACGQLHYICEPTIIYVRFIKIKIIHL